MMHANLHFLLVMDDRQVPVAAMLRKPGDECMFVYDLDDDWYHQLKMVQIAKVEGGGNVELLDGKGACPPEDSIGLTTRASHHAINSLRHIRRIPTHLV
ncbi:hypothetical protein EON65_15450 [archaeon]|nr:MAG: hypothetical protein EON65_15450 [archaeon]